MSAALHRDLQGLDDAREILGGEILDDDAPAFAPARQRHLCPEKAPELIFDERKLRILSPTALGGFGLPLPAQFFELPDRHLARCGVSKQLDLSSPRPPPPPHPFAARPGASPPPPPPPPLPP